ncbi:site-2 protease family protein [Erythrobacter oryzae]|uniref:site-2 protease family protein n=1 Tax=Erythrobacter oryzae TaxID=3019556 RepID=UPI0025541D8F|nr:site-2 protease family protein [Erythrobacter sp. COR-2]
MARKTLGDRLVHALWYLASGVLWVTAAQYEALDHNWLVAFVVISVVQFVVIVIHELGHAWAAWRCGARVHAICAVPFIWSARTRRVRFEPRMPARDIGGYVSYAFAEGRGSTRADMAISAAGPLANFASAAAVAAISGLLAMMPLAAGPAARPGPPPMVAVEAGTPPASAKPARVPSEEELGAFLARHQARQQAKAWAQWGEALSGLFVTLSVILGLLNLVPHRGSDGAEILAGWRRLRRR